MIRYRSNIKKTIIQVVLCIAFGLIMSVLSTASYHYGVLPEHDSVFVSGLLDGIFISVVILLN
jgi:hypothetical protein